MCTPPPFWLPGWTMSTFVPMLWNWSCTIRPADWQIETSRMTAATPMTMPSTVRPARILFFASARKATRNDHQRFMAVSLRRRAVARRLFTAVAVPLGADDHFLAVGQVARDDLRRGLVAQAGDDFDGGQQVVVERPRRSAAAVAGRAASAVRRLAAVVRRPRRRRRAFDDGPVARADLLGLGMESQRRVGHGQHAGVLLDLERQVGRHAGQQLELAGWPTPRPPCR